GAGLMRSFAGVAPAACRADGSAWRAATGAGAEGEAGECAASAPLRSVSRITSKSGGILRLRAIARLFPAPGRAVRSYGNITPRSIPVLRCLARPPPDAQ